MRDASLQTLSLDLPPPPWAQRFRSDDLDEVGAFVARFSGHHSRVIHGGGPFAFEQTWLTGDAVMAGWVRIGTESTVRGAVRSPTLHVVLNGGAEYRFGRRLWTTGPGAAMFIPPGWEYTTRRLPGTTFAMAFDHDRLLDAIGAGVPGANRPQQLGACPFKPERVRSSGIWASALDYLQATHQDHAPLHLAAAEAHLLGTIAGLLREETTLARGRSIADARVADLEAWIEANLEQPITLDRLCAVAGVGQRALQKSFESRRGMSPMRFVTERRLAEARRQLAAAGWRDDVTDIALRLGFGHLGRFASLYREAFGELPSQTIGRSRQAAPAR